MVLPQRQTGLEPNRSWKWTLSGGGIASLGVIDIEVQD